MSDVNLELTREYFELNNFMVLSAKKHSSPSGTPPGTVSIDLIVANLDHQPAEELVGLVLETPHLPSLARAIVGIRGWHSDRFWPSILTATPQIFNFISPDSLDYASRIFKGEQFKKVLVISELPATESFSLRMEEILRDKGVDHVIEFPVILEYLVSHVLSNRSYTESDTLQLLRILKRYGFIKGLQMEFDF